VLRAAYQTNGSDVGRSEQARSCLRRSVSPPPMAQGLTSGCQEMMDKATIEKAIERYARSILRWLGVHYSCWIPDFGDYVQSA